MRIKMIVWADKPFELPTDLPESGQWQSLVNDAGDALWSFKESDWTVLLELTDSYPASAEVLNHNSEYKSSMRLSVEPVTAEVGFHFLDAVISAVAKKCGGCLLEGPMGLVPLDADGKQVKEAAPTSA